jgi:hypothetical protein
MKRNGGLEPMQSYLAPTYLAPSAVIEPSVPSFPPLLVFLPSVLQVQLVCWGHLGTSKALNI